MIKRSFTAAISLLMVARVAASIDGGVAELPERNGEPGTNTVAVTPETRQELPAADPPAAGGPRDFASFKIITDRNIFDPNRSSRPPRSERRSETPRPVRTETFSLVGTMSYQSGEIAFFNSASSDYRKAVRVNDTIAGFKVTTITPTGVTLDEGDKKHELGVGSQVKRQDGGPWEFVAPRTTMAAASGAGAASASDDDDDEILKRLLQKREQEINR